MILLLVKAVGVLAGLYLFVVWCVRLKPDTQIEALIAAKGATARFEKLSAKDYEAIRKTAETRRAHVAQIRKQAVQVETGGESQERKKLRLA